MNKLLAIVALTLLAACQGPTPSTCTVEQQTGGSLVTCPDGTSAFIPNGHDGQSVTISSATETQCPNGGIVVTSGQASFPVCNGATGPAGQDGTSVQVIYCDGERCPCPTGGVELIAGDNSVFVCNGTEGTPGADGKDGLTPTIEVNPQECGTAGGIVVVLGDIRQPVCNGTDGEPGPAGEPGTPGSTPVITTQPATTCEFGGLDILADGVLIGTVCDGTPGQDGTCDCDDGGCEITCGENEVKYEGACYRLCNNEPPPHYPTCDDKWLSNSTSCDKTHDRVIACWP